MMRLSPANNPRPPSPAGGDCPFSGRPLEESSAFPRGKLVEKMHQRTRCKDNCFGNADKIFLEPQKNVDEWKNRCYDLIN